MHSDIHPAWCGCADCTGPRRLDAPVRTLPPIHRARLSLAAIGGAAAGALILSLFI